ncbi:MAG: crotonase/enoyl-CoA hydratase family protein [Acidimicrobiales bacterium]|nr:crotonase/enoyl-CoA hydratase family protein [Acidimicrobiales bacterium]
MEFTEITYELEGSVATITLDRPDRLNAFTVTMQRELNAAFDLADADDRVRVVIVTGRGRGFCAGADLGAGGDTFDADAKAKRVDDPGSGHRDSDADIGQSRYPRDFGGLLTLRIFQCLKPVIAAINGPAVGIGVTMTLPMDIRLAAESAKFGFVFAARGIVPEAASSWFLPRIVGIDRALEWCYSARVFPAEEALAGGLVRSVHPDHELLPAARELAQEIAEHAAPVSVALTRQMMWRMLGASHPMEAHRIDSRGVYSTGRSADAREGVLSFLEKRQPHWSLSASRDMPEWFPWWQEPDYE